MSVPAAVEEGVLTTRVRVVLATVVLTGVVGLTFTVSVIVLLAPEESGARLQVNVWVALANVPQVVRAKEVPGAMVSETVMVLVLGVSLGPLFDATIV